jgi:F0F1-type ATP synthase assembly protein I
MGKYMRVLKIQLKRHKVGILVGAVVGAIAAGYAINNGVADLSDLANSGKGIIDIFSRSAPVEVAKQKLYISFALIGAAVGYITDIILKKIL